MKIWITRDSASSIMFGGLERLQIWFVKPEFLMNVLSEKDRDTPFGTIGEDQGYYSKFGWYATQKHRVSELSIGNWLGYGEGENGELCNYIWEKLQGHFLNRPFREWADMERDGLVKQIDFLLELDIKIQLIKS